MQSYFLASRNPDNSNALVDQRLSTPSVNQAIFLFSNFLPPIQEVVLVSLDTIQDFVGASKTTSEFVVVLGCTLTTMFISNDKSAFSVSKDNLDYAILYNLHVPSESKESSDDEDFEIPLPPKCSKKNYDLVCKFQMEWFAKCPWAEMVLVSDGVLYMVHCRVCNEMGKKPYVMGPKLFTLQIHEKRKRHKKNILLYTAKRPTIVLEQLNSNNIFEPKEKTCAASHFVLVSQ